MSRRTLADQVYKREVAPATTISENEVAMRFGGSRGPAREAIVRCEMVAGPCRTFRCPRGRTSAGRLAVALTDSGMPGAFGVSSGSEATVAALKSRDAETAESAMRRHARSCRTNIQDTIKGLS